MQTDEHFSSMYIIVFSLWVQTAVKSCSTVRTAFLFEFVKHVCLGANVLQRYLSLSSPSPAFERGTFLHDAAADAAVQPGETDSSHNQISMRALKCHLRCRDPEHVVHFFVLGGSHQLRSNRKCVHTSRPNQTHPKCMFTCFH